MRSNLYDPDTLTDADKRVYVKHPTDDAPIYEPIYYATRNIHTGRITIFGSEGKRDYLGYTSRQAIKHYRALAERHATI